MPIVARFVVLAAGVGNADLLTKLSSRFTDQARRKSTKELVDGCQAVRLQYQLCLRGDLPAVSGRFGSFTVASHATGPGDAAHLGGLARRSTTRSPPWVRPTCASSRPSTRWWWPGSSTSSSRPARPWSAQASQLEWSVYVSRRAQHPTLAAADPSTVAQPVPAKLEKLGLEAFLAVWPSHLAYAQFVGDSVAERIGEALGPPGDFADGRRARPRWAPSAPPLAARWDRPDFAWQDWETFRQAWDIKPT